MEADNEDDLKNKADLHIAGRYMALDIFRFAVFLTDILTVRMWEINKELANAIELMKSLVGFNVHTTVLIGNFTN